MRTLLSALFLCVLSQVVGAHNILAFRGESDLSFMPSTERRETFHKQQDPLYRKKLSPEISSPRRLRVKGADTDSLKGCRFESGETGILVADGLLEDGSSAHAARPGGTYTTAVLPGQNLPFISRHVQLPSIDPLPCQSKAVGLGIGFRPCAEHARRVEKFNHCRMVGGSSNDPHLFDTSEIYQCDEGQIEIAGQWNETIENGYVFTTELGRPGRMEPRKVTASDFSNNKWCATPKPWDANQRERCGDKPGKCWDGKMETWDRKWQGYSCVTPDHK